MRCAATAASSPGLQAQLPPWPQGPSGLIHIHRCSNSRLPRVLLNHSLSISSSLAMPCAGKVRAREWVAGRMG
eukprot:scaffold44721_cov25-Tisochrysis_lutea.AAC.1